MIKDRFKENDFSIRWVIALKEEAQIIITQFKMSLLSQTSVFPIFKNFDGTHWLILSGIGRHNAAAATLYLYEKSNAPRWTSWINIGIAGCGKGNYGDLCLVDKIINNSNSEKTYPDTMKRSILTRMELLTTDFPITDYNSKELIDMEGSAFYDMASKIASRELIGLFKVISDGPSNDIKKLNKSNISDLIKSNISNINTVISYYELLSLREKKIINKPELFFEISNQWHFTVSQKHQLDSLVRRINTFGINKDIKCLLKDCKNSKSVISVLNKQIESHEVEWGRF